MISSSNNRAKQTVERAQPWLGTLVSIRCEGLGEREAHRAIEAAFHEIAMVHRLMSFHDPKSELSRLHRARAGEPVHVHPYTWEVLRQATALSVSTDGCFDVTVGAELVEWELLPRQAVSAGDRRGSWRDIELLPENRVVFHRPLCVDLGGIAKGFAVDLATECLSAHGARHTVVNAGGDIRVQGIEAEPIQLSAESTDALPVLELTDGSIASSCGDLQRRSRLHGSHVDGRSRKPAPTDRFVSVVAERCIIADALTKVVMARGRESAPALREFGASAWLHDAGQAWQCLGPLEEQSAAA
ncbi:MAG TPA: FAD:protein FMN transferase [Edaphobacter sp.]